MKLNSKTLTTAALAGLFAAGSVSASLPQSNDTTATSITSKKEKEKCSGKDGCKGKDKEKDKEKCSGKDGCKGKDKKKESIL